MIVVLVAALIQHLLLLIGAVLGLFAVIAAAVYSLTRTGTRRVLGPILAVPPWSGVSCWCLTESGCGTDRSHRVLKGD
jgi:hypothetical protein